MRTSRSGVQAAASLGASWQGRHASYSEQICGKRNHPQPACELLHVRIALTRPIAAFAAVTVLVGTIASCGSNHATSSQATSRAGAATTSSATPPSAAAPMLTIRNYGYTAPRSVQAGAHVMVKNNDDVAHTVTADRTGSFDVTIQGNSTAIFTAPSKPGSYKFHCKFHSNMHGTLDVT